jgi:hypothetical protein
MLTFQIETTVKMPGTYLSSDASDERGFFEKIARRQKFDPLIAENWYSITDTYVKKQQVQKKGEKRKKKRKR